MFQPVFCKSSDDSDSHGRGNDQIYLLGLKKGESNCLRLGEAMSVSRKWWPLGHIFRNTYVDGSKVLYCGIHDINRNSLVIDEPVSIDKIHWLIFLIPRQALEQTRIWCCWAVLVTLPSLEGSSKNMNMEVQLAGFSQIFHGFLMEGHLFRFFF